MTNDDRNTRTRQSDGLPRPTATGATTATGASRATGVTYQPADGDDDATRWRNGDDVAVIRRRELRADRIRWSAIWAGLVVALGIYMFLQLALVASGIVELADASSSDAFWSAAAALVAFLVGGITAGASAMWDGADDGLLHGIVMWAVGLVALITLAALGGGIALGTFDTSDVFDQFSAEDADPAVANDDAEEAAGWALIGLASALAASAIGATIGAKLWPRNRDRDDDTVHDRRP
jgi:hypothetical protein